jgi:peptidoglycan LD-endopeptidase LytH
LKDILKKHQPDFSPVVEFHPQTDSLLLLDFTSNNTTLTPALLENTENFSQYIEQQLKTTGARYGIGGYGEDRTVYSRSKVFDAPVNGDEPRRLHLGMDIWGKPNTAVRAPLGGIVHSFAFNNNFGDYGATIILSHQLELKTFYTLYGHLSLNDLKNLEEGQTIHKGETFAEFGLPFENGHWPPHLHFQIIIDMENYRGDYPGVCKVSEKEKYFSNCPDPDLVLQMNQYLK